MTDPEREAAGIMARVLDAVVGSFAEDLCSECEHIRHNGPRKARRTRKHVNGSGRVACRAAYVWSWAEARPERQADMQPGTLAESSKC